MPKLFVLVPLIPILMLANTFVEHWHLIGEEGQAPNALLTLVLLSVLAGMVIGAVLNGGD